MSENQIGIINYGDDAQYHEKYLKYKNKYLELKIIEEQFGGAMYKGDYLIFGELQRINVLKRAGSKAYLSLKQFLSFLDGQAYIVKPLHETYPTLLRSFGTVKIRAKDNQGLDTVIGKLKDLRNKISLREQDLEKLNTILGEVDGLNAVVAEVIKSDDDESKPLNNRDESKKCITVQIKKTTGEIKKFKGMVKTATPTFIPVNGLSLIDPKSKEIANTFEENNKEMIAEVKGKVAQILGVEDAESGIGLLKIVIKGKKVQLFKLQDEDSLITLSQNAEFGSDPKLTEEFKSKAKVKKSKESSGWF
jgi:hypothetical protein